MNQSPVTIGPISLQNFEVPQSIRFGGQQRLAVHRLADGTRRVEPLGPDDSEIRFQGTFFGQDAETRAREFNSLRMNGSAIWLTWQTFRYRVIIREFSADYHSRSYIDYRVCCVIVHQSEVFAAYPDITTGPILSAISGATSALAGTQIDLTSLSSAAAATGALISGTVANSRAENLSALGLSAIQSEMDQQSERLMSYDQVDASPLAAASTFAAQLGCSASCANTVRARAYIRCARLSLNSLEV